MSLLQNPERKWCFRDLFVDHQTGKLRETKVWSNIGKAAMTWAFVYCVLNENYNDALWLMYGGIVVMHELGSRWFNQRQQALEKETPK